MRTTTWHIVRLAWALWRNRYRKHLRIGQLIDNAADKDIFYTENAEFAQMIEGYK